MEYRYGSHTIYNIEYHFVWITKYRYKILSGEVGLSQQRYQTHHRNLMSSRVHYVPFLHSVMQIGFGCFIASSNKFLG